MRFGPWNVRTLTIELVKILRKREINCLQETKWTGAKARDLEGFKLWYPGAFKSKNRVGIMVDRDLQDQVVEVRRVNDRIMAIS